MGAFWPNVAHLLAFDRSGRRLAEWPLGALSSRAEPGVAVRPCAIPEAGTPGLLGPGERSEYLGQGGSIARAPLVPLYERGAGLRCGALRWPRILTRLLADQAREIERQFG